MADVLAAVEVEHSSHIDGIPKKTWLTVQCQLFFSALVSAISIVAREWLKKWDLPINPARYKYLTIGREVLLRLDIIIKLYPNWLRI